MANDVSWLLLGRDQCGHGERQRAAKPSDAAKLDAILGKVDDWRHFKPNVTGYKEQN